MDTQHLAAPITLVSEKFPLIQEFLKVRGLVKEQLNSYNHFVNIEIKNIVGANNEIRSNVDPEFYLKFKEVKIGEPSILVDGVPEKLLPQSCRLTGATYAAPIKTSIEFMCEHKGKKEICKKKNVVIGRLPVMLRSCCCVLYTRDETELVKLGECPIDPGGYFIVKGDEKVILMQEQLSNNRIFTGEDSRGNVIASVTSRTATHMSVTVIVMEKDKLRVQLNQFFEEKLPLMVVMKAMGMKSDQEVVQLIAGNDVRYMNLLWPSFEECVLCKVNTQTQALRFLEKKVRKPRWDKKDQAFTILCDVFIAHVPVNNKDLFPKCRYAALMSRRVLGVALSGEKDDKYFLGNRSFELTGPLLSSLFEDLLKRVITEARRKVDAILSKPTQSRMFDFSQHIVTDIISHGLERALVTGNWHVKRFQENRIGMTQVLSRMSFISAMACLTRIQKPQFDKSKEARALHTSQSKKLCPCDTPVGESCGLILHLALMTHITTFEDEILLISMCYTWGVTDTGGSFHNRDAYLVMLNGVILGEHRMPQTFASNLRKLRRAGKIGMFVSVFVNEKQHCVYIASDGGRVCRPVIIADKGVSRVRERHMQWLADGIWTIDDFLRHGLIEYLDANEEMNAEVALGEREAKLNITHIEIENFTTLGVCAGLIPFSNHNHSKLNIYQCAIGKQAMGNIANNQLFRMDSVLRLLVYPQRPLLTTKTIELTQYDKLGAGHNAIVAVMSYSGYNSGDAIVMNKSSLDRGFGHCIVMKKTGITKELRPKKNLEILMEQQRGKHSKEKFEALDDDGIASPGLLVRKGDFLVDLQTSLSTKREEKYWSSLLKHDGLAGDSSVVDRVALVSNDDRNLCINLVMRQTRHTEVGDLYSTRHGQKGVCGAIFPQEDMVFSEHGICPDLIINPHAIFDKKAVGNLREILWSKAAALSGRFNDGTPFQKDPDEKSLDISETLVKYGFHYRGKDFLYSGETGCPLEAYVFMGPIYYQKLKHMVLDKMHACGRSQRSIMTRQTIDGKRLGEMERDCLISYGASSLIYERLMISGDKWEVQVCRACGLLGYHNHEIGVGFCSSCRTGNNVSTIAMPYACKLLFQELQSMNIVPRVRLTEA